jgi:hypothetical protein
MERKAELYGLDMPSNLNVNLAPTAESIAAYLGWDNDTPIDVDSVEINHSQALDLAPDERQRVPDAPSRR